jgi:hypothetical protein
MTGPAAAAFTVEASLYGVIDAQLELPADTIPGAYTLSAASAHGGTPPAPVALEVTARAPDPGQTPTPPPGQDPTPDDPGPSQTDTPTQPAPSGSQTPPADPGGDVAPPAAGPSEPGAQPPVKTIKVKFVKVSAKRFAKGTKPKIKVAVKLAGGTKPVGKLAIYVGGKKVKTVKLTAKKKGVANVVLPKRYRKAIKVRAVYLPSQPAKVARGASKTIKVQVRK